MCSYVHYISSEQNNTRGKIDTRQEEILKFIHDFIETNGFPPSYREIGTHFNITSTFGVKRHLDALIKERLY